MPNEATAPKEGAKNGVSITGSISFQFFSFIVMLLLLLLLLLNIFPYVSTRDAVYQEKEKAMESQASTLASALAGLPVGKVSGSVTALRLTARALLAAAGILFISPGLVTDAIALALIGAQALVSRVLLPQSGAA